MRRLMAALGVAAAWQAESVYACAACFGQSDSPLAEAMNWGILCLLGIIACVLGGVVVFFVHVGRRSAALNRPAPNQPAETEK
jgi:hypothetical protein